MPNAKTKPKGSDSKSIIQPAALHISTCFVDGRNGAKCQETMLADILAALNRITLCSDLQTELLEIPALLANAGFLLAAATFKKVQARQALDAISAQVAERILRQRLNSGGKTTDAAIKAAVEASPEVISAERKLSQIEYERAQLQAIFNALEVRDASLVTIGELAAHGQPC